LKGILQYCSTDDGTYKNVGTIRLRKNKAYEVKAITDKSRIGDEETICYEVKIQLIALELNTDFLDQSEWFFRMAFFDDLVMIKLGERYYQVDFNGLININEIVYHKVELSFMIDIDEYPDFAVPESLPVSEGGIIIEDADLYIEAP